MQDNGAAGFRCLLVVMEWKGQSRQSATSVLKARSLSSKDDDTYLYAFNVRTCEGCAFPLLRFGLLYRSCLFTDWPEMVKIGIFAPRDTARIA